MECENRVFVRHNVSSWFPMATVLNSPTHLPVDDRSLPWLVQVTLPSVVFS